MLAVQAYLGMFPQTFEASLGLLSLWAGKNVNRTSSDLENVANLTTWVLPASASMSSPKDHGGISLIGRVWSLGGDKSPRWGSHTRPAEHV